MQSILDDAKLRWQVLHVHEEGQYTGVIQEVKTTFFYYPFAIQASCELKDALMIPDLLTLAAMKAYALGRRAKWKDYVDLYFIMHDYYTLSEIIQKSQEIFWVYFQSAQFIEQLAYHEDINYDEVVEYLIPDPPTDAQVKAFLIERAIED